MTPGCALWAKAAVAARTTIIRAAPGSIISVSFAKSIYDCYFSLRQNPATERNTLVPVWFPIGPAMVVGFKNVGGTILIYLLFDTAGTSIFENSFSSTFGFTTTLSMIIFSGGTGVSRIPKEFLPTGRTLVSRTNGI